MKNKVEHQVKQQRNKVGKEAFHHEARPPKRSKKLEKEASYHEARPPKRSKKLQNSVVLPTVDQNLPTAQGDLSTVSPSQLPQQYQIQQHSNPTPLVLDSSQIYHQVSPGKKRQIVFCSRQQRQIVYANGFYNQQGNLSTINLSTDNFSIPNDIPQVDGGKDSFNKVGILVMQGRRK